MARPDWTQLAPKIRNARLLAGLTIPDVATKTGFSIQSLYKWEKGATEPCATSFIVLVALYGLDPLSLVAA